MITKKSVARSTLKKIRKEDLSFGKMMESIRLCEAITQAELARKLKISRAHLCDIEKGRRTVTPEKAAEFAEILGYSVSQFVARAIEDSLNRMGLKFKVEVKAA